MTEKNTSQSQQRKRSNTAEAPNYFQKAAEENIARMESMFGEFTKMQEKGIEQTHQVIDEAAKLMKEQINYSTKLSSEFQRISFETARQAAQMMVNPWMQA